MFHEALKKAGALPTYSNQVRRKGKRRGRPLLGEEVFVNKGSYNKS